MKIGIIGHGMVGGALNRALKQKGFKTVVHDPFKHELHEKGIKDTEIAFVCVPTPTVNHSQDLTAVLDVLEMLSEKDAYKGLVVIKSTVLPGTTRLLKQGFPNLRLAHNPEFLREKHAFEETMNQPVILLSAEDAKDRGFLHHFWRLFDEEVPIQIAEDTRVTEIQKYVHNCFLAMKVSFCNEISEYCDVVGVGFDQVMSGAIAVGKIGESHTVVAQDGKPGFGGACFPKDTKAFLSAILSVGLKPDVLLATVNGNMRRRGE